MPPSNRERHELLIALALVLFALFAIDNVATAITHHVPLKTTGMGWPR